MDSLLRNIVTYIFRFAGDLVTLLIGGISAIPIVYSYLDVGHPWITSSTVKWGCLALGFVIASYRIWARTEAARTTDAVSVLLSDAQNIRRSLKWVIEHYAWPPTVVVDGREQVVMQPMRDEYSFSGSGLGHEVRTLRKRILDHNKLVQEVEALHGLRPLEKLDPVTLHQANMLRDFDQYIERLAALSKPPPSLFEALSQRRYLR